MFLKIRLLIPTIIRWIAIAGILASIFIAIRSMQPDEKVRKTEFIGTEYEYDSVVDVIPNPYTIEMSLTILVSSIMIFGFASTVEASETFLAQYRPEEEFEE